MSQSKAQDHNAGFSKESLGVVGGEDIGENSMCCERAATVTSTKIKREVQGHLDVGVGESCGMWRTNGDPPEKSEE